MIFPILDHDSTPEAFIEPSRVIRRRDMPEHCVVCFFKDVLEQIIEEYRAKKLVTNRWEDGPHAIYEIEHQGQRLAFYHPGIGAPLSAALLEEAIAFGCRKFIACGGAGVLDKSIAVGNLIVVTSAVRDEGTSYHYLSPAQEVIANATGVSALVQELKASQIPYLLGKTWTTDAPYRETPKKIALRREQGCLTVEMESAAMLAVAQFRDVVFGQVLYGGDDLSGEEWDQRAWHTQAEVRKNLFWLCASACLRL